EYKLWKWARAWLRSSSVNDDAKGSTILTLLDGDALKMCEDIGDGMLEQPGGEDLIPQTLDDRYLDKPAPEKVVESTRRCPRLRAEQGGEAAQYTARARSTGMETGRGGVILPDIARGVLLSDGCQLDRATEAMVMAAAGRSLSELDVA
ncbi:unnamed protein product, partial [Prorocentrum cordatum]